MGNTKSLLLALAAGLLLLAPQTAEAAKEPPVLMVEGTGRAETAPDCATISIGVVSKAQEAKTAQEENAKKATAVERALVASGIPKANIKTHGYYFTPLYEYSEQGRENEISGYHAENTVTVRVDNIDDVSRTIDLALKSGANSISSLHFSAKDTEKVKKAALNIAVQDAYKKADALASALGKKVVGLKSVSESSYPIAERSFGTKMLMAQQDAMPTPIAPGMLEMQVDVHIEYYLNE